MRPPGWRFFLSSAFPETRLFFCFMKFYYVTNIFHLHTYDNETTVLFGIFWNFYGNTFCFFIFFKRKKNYNLTFDDTSKCAVVRYSNLNSRSINKPYLRAVEYDISFFFDFLFIFIFTRLLQKTLWNNYHFLIQTFKTHFKM